MKKIFEQRSEMEVTKGLIVHVPSNSYNVSGLKLWNKKKATQQRGHRVTNYIVFN